MQNRTRRGRPTLTDEEKLWQSAARACNISVATAKRYVRRGIGSPATCLALGRMLELSNDEIELGTNRAKTRRATAP